MDIEFTESVGKVLESYHTELTITRLATDAINGYGRKVMWQVGIRVLDSECKLCGARALLTSAVDQCMPPRGHNHKWVDGFLESVCGYGETLDLAMESAERDAKKFLAKIRN